MTHRAVFFDRDGTLILDKHYMHKLEDIEYYDDSFTALARLRDENFKLFIVTNQSGIGRGMFDESDMHAVHLQIIKDYKDKNIEILDVAHCPHSPDDNCDCRKPSPLLINKLASKYEIDLSQSFMIGDKVSDAEAGEKAGSTGVLLNVKDERYENFSNLTEVVDFILS